MASVKWDTCICHGYSENPGNEVKFTDISWTKLCEAAKRRRDHVYDTLRPYIDGTLEVPLAHTDIVRHVNCYKVYTLPKSILLMERKRTLDDDSGPEGQPSPEKRLTRSKIEPINKETCIICLQRFHKDAHDRRRQQTATPFTLQSAIDTLRDAAVTRGDKRVICELAGGARGGIDAIAGDILKHDICYRNYTCPSNIQTATHVTTDAGGVQKALHDIVRMIQLSVVDELTIWDLNTVYSLYVAALSRHGETLKQSPSNTRRMLRTMLSKQFGDKLRFYRQVRRNQPELIYSHRMTIDQVVQNCKDMEHDADDEAIEDDLTLIPNDEHTNPMLNAYLLGRHVREQLQLTENMAWPPTPDLCTNEYSVASIPTILFNLVSWIVTGDENFTDDRVELRESNHAKVLSICQDILFCSRNGRVLTPKHVSLAMAVRRVTGSTELLTMLNKFGHTVSTSKLQEIEVAVGELRQQEGADHIPANIVKHVPVSFVFDNNDFQEETPSGKDTTHCTNGIIIQNRVYTCMPPPADVSIPTHSKKKRSLTYAPKLVSDYPVAPRTGPDRVPDAATLITTSVSSSRNEARDQDQAWLLARLCPDLTLPGGIYTQVHLVIHSNQSSNTQHQTFNKIYNGYRSPSYCVKLYYLFILQVVPGWSRHNQILCSGDEALLPQNVGYMPVVNESSGDLATVYTVLTNAIDTVDILEYESGTPETQRPSVAITVDQAIYAKAVEVCNNPRIKDSLESVVLRMGAFHVSTTFIAVMGRRYASAGLRDILMEAGILAVGSVDQVLNGRHYNRAISSLKLMYEAMWRLRWAAFLEWKAEEQGSDSPNFGDLYELVSDHRRNETPENMQNLVSSESFLELQRDFARFQSHCGPNETFWSDFIDMVELLLCFIRSSRTRNWPMHINCLQEMLPWMAAYDRTNYSRYVPVYILDMVHLPETHPDMHNRLMAGEFAVQLTKDRTFNSIPHDQTIEVTINKDTKTSGGLIGKTLRHASVNKWIWTAADKATYYQCSKDLCSMGEGGSTTHKDGGATRVARDEEKVQRIVQTVTNLVDPFKEHKVITHISSGKHASLSIEKDLLSAGQIGLKAVHSFATERLSPDGETSFHDPLPKHSLQTFASFTAKTRSTGHADTEEETTAVFAHLFDAGQDAQVARDVLLSYELTSVPRSLADADGAKHANNKADLLHILSNLATDTIPPPQSTHVIDAMAVLQSISKPTATYAELAVQVFLLMIKGTGNRALVHWVVDTYPDVSIKQAQQRHRENVLGGALHYTIRSGSQRVPTQFKRALRSGPYKEELLRFFLKEWSDDDYTQHIGDRVVYVTASVECFQLKIGNGSMQCVPQVDLACSHEEADTRLLFHAKHASVESDEPIIIRSPDTDVLVLAVFMCGEYPEYFPLVFRVQHQKAWRYISVPSISGKLDAQVCKALPGMHAFGGSDSTSQFAGRGKKTTMKLLLENPKFLDAMCSLGT